MVIIYNLETKEITSTEDNTMVLSMPANMTFEQQKEYYNSIGKGFISLPYEMGIYIYNFKLSFDVNNNFIGLQPK